MRWSFGRPTTVRTRIVALALAPVVALMVLWSFAMVSVTGELRALVRVQGVYDDFGTPVDTAVGQIQIERRLAAAYLGADHGTAAALDLMAQQRRTDRAVTAMRTAIRDGDRGGSPAGSDRRSTPCCAPSTGWRGCGSGCCPAPSPGTGRSPSTAPSSNPASTSSPR